MDPETHKEIVEIKKDIRELRNAQDAGMQHDRGKYEKLLEEAINGDSRTAQVLLEVDGFQSARDIQQKTGIPQPSCWRKLDRLVSKEVIYQLEESKKTSPVYQQSRWFKKLRLDDDVRDKYLNHKVEQKEVQNGVTTSESDQNQNL